MELLALLALEGRVVIGVFAGLQLELQLVQRPPYLQGVTHAEGRLRQRDMVLGLLVRGHEAFCHGAILSAVTLSTLIGIAILLIGVGYLLALCGINRFEKNVKEFGKAINGAE